MAKLIIENPKQGQKRPPRYQVYLNDQPIGNISAEQQKLELDLSAGQHTLQVRSGKSLGRSNRLSIAATDDHTTVVHIFENLALHFGVFAGFCLLYFILRTQLHLGIFATAAISVGTLYAALSFLRPLNIKQVKQ